ncbi:glycoside hydrolase superfamily [Pisolithus sp. B1]|nr:glycoside hydrolase superfamily [Pisolithus sp. B1]
MSTSAPVFVLALTLSQVAFIGAHASEGVAKLPVMGFNTWNAYQCNISEDIVVKNANLMVSLGLADAGYNYVNIDDCYAAKYRNSAGDIVANQTKFPSGMKALTDSIHALGLNAGIYSDAGWFTCQLYPGSYQNEERDARLFRDDWGFDYLKYDNCAVPFDNITRQNIMGRYARMANAISDLSQSTGKPPLILSLCEWGREQVWLWGKRYGQSWRTTDDISPSWLSVASIINQNSFYSWASDFYGHNDMDMLEIGNGNLTYEESKTHFTAWALMKSPLLIGTDLEVASNQTIEILTNREIIAINQDPVVGTGVTPFRWGSTRTTLATDTHPSAVLEWGESERDGVYAGKYLHFPS